MARYTREGLRRGSTGDRRISKGPEGYRRGSKGRRGLSMGIEGTSKVIDGPRRFSEVLEGPRRSSSGRRRYSGCSYGFLRRWQELSRLCKEKGMSMEGQRCRLAVWG